MEYTYLTKVAIDEDGNIARATTGQVFAFDDDAFALPLQVSDVEGVARLYVTADERGILQGFTVNDHPKVKWRSGEFVSVLGSFDGMLNAANLAADRAEAAYQLLADFGDTTDTLVHSIVDDDASLTHDWLTGQFTPLAQVNVWSEPLKETGWSGISVIRLDASAARNTPTNARAIIAMGRDALGAATAPHDIIAIGDDSMGRGQPGPHNIGIGSYTLTALNGGHRNVVLGSLAGRFVSNGHRNVFVGRDAGQCVTTGYENTGIGYCALGSTHGTHDMAGQLAPSPPSPAFGSTAIGNRAGAWLTGSEMTIVGSAALASARNVTRSVYIGNRAGEVLGSDVSENGFQLNLAPLSGTFVQTGNTVTVTATAHGLTTGKYAKINFSGGLVLNGPWVPVTVTGANTFTVYSPVSKSTSGTVSIIERETTTAVAIGGGSVVIGHVANGHATRSGGSVTIIGYQAGLAAEGRRNTLLGNNSGLNLTTGQDNLGLGYGAGSTLVGGGAVTTQSNWVAIGHEAPVVGPNTVRIGNDTQAVYTKDGLINGPSDRRLKTAIEATPYGLEFVNSVIPSQFAWKSNGVVQQGFIAQQVEEVAPDFTGVTYNADTDQYSAAANEFIPPLYRAVQEISARLDALESASG